MDIPPSPIDESVRNQQEENAPMKLALSTASGPPSPRDSVRFVDSGAASGKQRDIQHEREGSNEHGELEEIVESEELAELAELAELGKHEELSKPKERKEYKRWHEHERSNEPGKSNKPEKFNEHVGPEKAINHEISGVRFLCEKVLAEKIQQNYTTMEYVTNIKSLVEDTFRKPNLSVRLTARLKRAKKGPQTIYWIVLYMDGTSIEESDERESIDSALRTYQGQLLTRIMRILAEKEGEQRSSRGPGSSHKSKHRTGVSITKEGFVRRTKKS